MTSRVNAIQRTEATRFRATMSGFALLSNSVFVGFYLMGMADREYMQSAGGGGGPSGSAVWWWVLGGSVLLVMIGVGISQRSSSPYSGMYPFDEHVMKSWEQMADEGQAIAREMEALRSRYSEWPSPDVVPLPTANFEKAFTEGGVFQSTSGRIVVDVVDAGLLPFPTGQIACADPGYSKSDWNVAARRISPGDYRLFVSLVEGRSAAIQVVIDSTANVVRYEHARFEDSPSGGLWPNEYFMVGVDSGQVGIMDASLAERMPSDFEESEALYAMMLAAVYGKGNGRAAYGFWSLPKSTQRDMFVSGSGAGDGGYPCFWGLDAADRPVQFVVDFFMLGESKEQVVEVPMELSMLGVQIEHPTLREQGFQLIIDQDARSETVWSVNSLYGRSVSVVELLDFSGRRLASTETSSSQGGPSGWRQYLNGVPEDFTSGTLRIKYSTWKPYG